MTATNLPVLYGSGAPPVPPNDPDALAFLAAARGQTAADEARACVRWIDQEILGRLVSLDLGRAHELVEVLPDMLDRRGVRGEACRALEDAGITSGPDQRSAYGPGSRSHKLMCAGENL